MTGCKLIMTAADMEQNRGKWLELRRGSIGGSDAAAVMGLNPWKSAYTLWLEKTGELEEEDKSDIEAVHFGEVLEEVVAREFCRREKKQVRKCGLYQSEKYPFLTGSFDRLINGEQAGLEIKTASSYKRAEWDGGEIPPAYYIQCQHYMLVSGFPRWHLVALVGGNHFVDWTIERNDKDIAALLDAERDFWDKVQRHIMPEIDGSESTSISLKAMYAGGNVEPIALPGEALSLLKRLDELREAKGDIEGQTEEIKNKLCAMMGDNEIAIAGEGDAARRVTWKTYPGRVTIDSKGLKADLPDIYAKYSRQGGSYRRFIW